VADPKARASKAFFDGLGRVLAVATDPVGTTKRTVSRNAAKVKAAPQLAVAKSAEVAGQLRERAEALPGPLGKKKAPAAKPAAKKAPATKAPAKKAPAAKAPAKKAPAAKAPAKKAPAAKKTAPAKKAPAAAKAPAKKRASVPPVAPAPAFVEPEQPALDLPPAIPDPPAESPSEPPLPPTDTVI
jgi:hypothetical protein